MSLKQEKDSFSVTTNQYVIYDLSGRIHLYYSLGFSVASKTRRAHYCFRRELGAWGRKTTATPETNVRISIYNSKIFDREECFYQLRTDRQTMEFEGLGKMKRTMLQLRGFISKAA